MLTVADILEINNAGENVAEHLDDAMLSRFANHVIEAYKKDKESRAGWDDRTKSAVELCMQTIEEKSYPWVGASNIKFPLLTVAVHQFASRVFPALVKMPYPVSARINGYKTDEKLEAGERMAKYMSWQLTDDMPDWIEDQDKLCHSLPIYGSVFKKTYRDFANNVNVSDAILPDRVVFDYYAKNIEVARTVTHWFYLYEQEIEEYKRLGLYRNVDINGGSTPDDDDFHTRDSVNLTERPSGQDTPNKILECHCWYDIDEDGYEEPYICTVEENSRLVLRIVPRYSERDIIVGADGRIAKINPKHYFTQYIFFPDPSGGNLGIGWGTMLYHINQTINSTMNQLTDAGTLNNLGGGLISTELRMASGDVRTRPGQWTRVDSTMGDLSRSIYPWPQQPPSQVLYQLMTLLIDWGQRVTAVSDAMAGVSPPSNVPATTTLAMLEQGQKVFQGIYQRIFRAMSRELKKLKDLNREYMNPIEYYKVLDNQPLEPSDDDLERFMTEGATPASAGMAYRTDFNRDDTDVSLSADQQISSEQVAMFRMQLLMQMQQAGMQVNPAYIERQLLVALGLPDSEKGSVFMPPPQGPSPEQQMAEFEAQHNAQMDQARVGIEQTRADAEAKRVEQEGVLGSAKLELEHRKMAIKALTDHRGLDIDEMSANVPNEV